MAYSINWQIEGRVLYERIYGDTTIEELTELNGAVNILISQQAIPPMHVIIDLSDIAHYPTNLREIAGTMRTNDRSKLGWTVIITQNRFVRYIASITIQLAGARFRIFGELPEAYRFLTSVDDSLSLPGL